MYWMEQPKQMETSLVGRLEGTPAEAVGLVLTGTDPVSPTALQVFNEQNNVHLIYEDSPIHDRRTYTTSSVNLRDFSGKFTRIPKQNDKFIPLIYSQSSIALFMLRAWNISKQTSVIFINEDQSGIYFKKEIGSRFYYDKKANEIRINSLKLDTSGSDLKRF